MKLRLVGVAFALLVMLLVSASRVHAQRGGFGRGSGRGIGHSSVSVPGHSRVDGGFLTHSRVAPERGFVTELGFRANVGPFTGGFGIRRLGRINRGFPFSFFSDPCIRLHNCESGLGFGIPPLATSFPPTTPFVGQISEFPRAPVRLFVDLPRTSSVRVVQLDRVQPSRSAIIFLPTNAFEAK